MSSVVISGDTSGAVTLTVPAVAGTNTVTIPASTGTVMVSGNMPAFSAYQSSGQTPAATTFTKVQFQTKVFDTANAYDNTTNYRFTPQVAGYYQINAGVNYGSAVSGFIISIYKNGTEYMRGGFISSATTFLYSITGLVYCNGTTDYIEIYTFNTTGGVTTQTGATPMLTYVSGSMVRAA